MKASRLVKLLPFLLLAACGARNETPAVLVPSYVFAENTYSTLLSPSPEGRANGGLQRLFSRGENSFANKMGVIEIESENDFQRCTAFFIADRYVFTAAHCVVDPKNNESARRISFLPGLISDQDDNSLRYFAKSVIVPRSYLTRPDSSSDFALVELDMEGEISYTAEHLSNFALGSPDPLANHRLYVAGFPLGEGPTSLHYSDCSGSIGRIGEKTYSYSCETFLGMSGGPVFYYDSTKRIYRVLGLHIGQHSESKTAAFRLIEKASLDSLAQYLNGAPSDEFTSWALQESKFHGVFLRNSCGEDLQVQIKQRRYGTHYHPSEVRVRANQRKIVYEAITGKLSLNFFDRTGKPIEVFLGSENKKSSEKEIVFYPGQLFKDHTIAVHCND